MSFQNTLETLTKQSNLQTPPIHIGLKSPIDDEIIDIYEPGLELINAHLVKKIASYVRNHGSKPNKKWCEFSGSLPNGGTVDLQASKKMFIGHIHLSASCPFEYQVAWDRELNILNSLGILYPQENRWLWYYHFSGAWPGIPYPFSKTRVTQGFKNVLGHIEHSIARSRGMSI